MKRLEIGTEEIKHLAKSLRKVDFFKDLSISDLDQVLQFVGLYSFDSEETIFKQGQRGDALYIIHGGKVQISAKKVFFLPAKNIAQLQEGDFFGEMALVDKKPRSATVKTVGPAKLFALLRADFQNVVANNASFAKQIKSVSAHRHFESERAA